MSVFFTVLLGLVGFLFFVFGIIFLSSFIADILEYRRAKREIFEWVEYHRRKIRSDNRYALTAEELKTYFPEYDINVIYDVWEALISEGRVMRHPFGGAWSINPNFFEDKDKQL